MMSEKIDNRAAGGTSHGKNVHDKNTPGKDRQSKALPAADDLDGILRLAWRPAWSMRSRKGCLEPLIAWWKCRRSRSG